MNEKWYLFKINLKYKDPLTLQKIKVLKYTIFAIVLAILVYFLNPISNIQGFLAKKEYSNSYTFSLNDIWNANPYNSLDFVTNNNNDSNKNNNQDISSTGTYSLPMSGQITSDYGMRTDPITGEYTMHTGIDISGVHRDNVETIEAGVVTFAGSQNGFGNCVEIKHETKSGTFYTFYAHLSEIFVTEGHTVNAYDIIGLEGGDPATDPNPGNSTGHHLHFEVRTNSGYGYDIEPKNILDI